MNLSTTNVRFVVGPDAQTWVVASDLAAGMELNLDAVMANVPPHQTRVVEINGEKLLAISPAAFPAFGVDTASIVHSLAGPVPPPVQAALMDSDTLKRIAVLTSIKRLHYFESHLQAAGFKYQLDPSPDGNPQHCLLTVETCTPSKLADCVKAAANEAARMELH